MRGTEGLRGVCGAQSRTTRDKWKVWLRVHAKIRNRHR